MKYAFVIFIQVVFVFANAIGQEEGNIILFGNVVDETGNTLTGVHVINRNSLMGTVSNKEGIYQIAGYVSDTVQFSFIGFRLRQIVVPKIANGMTYQLDIEMIEDTILLKSAVVYPFPSNAEALMKEIFTIDIPDTSRMLSLHLDMVPIKIEPNMDNYRPGEMKIVSFGSGITAIYDAVSHDGKMKKKYLQVLEHERIDKLAAARLTDSLIMRATGLVEKESLKAFRAFCNLQPEFIVERNDYELYVALIDCYKSFLSQ